MLDNVKAKRGHTGKARNEENLARMEAIRERLKLSKADFSLALGYVTDGGYNASTRNGGANLMQLLAAEAVEMRYGGKDHSRPMTYTLLAVHPDGRIDAIPIGGRPQTATIMGRDYILVPKKG